MKGSPSSSTNQKRPWPITLKNDAWRFHEIFRFDLDDRLELLKHRVVWILNHSRVRRGWWDGGMVGWLDGVGPTVASPVRSQFVDLEMSKFSNACGYPQSSSIYRWIFHDQLAIGDPPWRHGHPKNDPPKKSLGHHYRGATITWMWESLVARNLPWLKNDKHSSHKHGDDLGWRRWHWIYHIPDVWIVMIEPESLCKTTGVGGSSIFEHLRLIGVQAKICIQELERSSNVTVCYRK